MSRSNPTSTAQQPMIVKYVQPDRSGIQAHNFTRHSIGYVVRGKKCVYYGDVCHEIPQGTLFYMGMGNHYTEDVPEQGKNFEQIVFYYTFRSAVEDTQPPERRLSAQHYERP